MGYQKGHRPKGITGNPFTKEQESFIVNLRENQPSRLDWQEMSNRFNKRFPTTPRSKGALQVHYSRSLQPSKRNQSRRDRRPDRASLTSSDYGGDDEDRGSPEGWSNPDSHLPSSSPSDRKSKKAKREPSAPHHSTNSNHTSLDAKEEEQEDQLLKSTSKFEIEAAEILHSGRKRPRRVMNYTDSAIKSDDTSSDTLTDVLNVSDTSTSNHTTRTLIGNRSAKSAKRAMHTRADGRLRHPNMNEERKKRPYDDETSSLSDAPLSPSPFDSHLATAADQAALAQISPSTAFSGRSHSMFDTESFSFGVDSQFRRSHGPSLSTRTSLSPPVPRDLSQKSSSTELEEQSTLRSTPQVIPSSGSKRKFHSVEDVDSSNSTPRGSSLTPLQANHTKSLPSLNTGSSQDIPRTRRSARPLRPSRPRDDSLVSPMTKVPIIEELQQPTIEAPQHPAKPLGRITLKLAAPTHRESAIRETQRVPKLPAASDGNQPLDQQLPTAGPSAAKKRKTNAAPWGMLIT